MKFVRREASVERYFVGRLRKAGCLVYKFVSPGNDGVPDRIVITPGGRVIFVELKTEYGKTSKIQDYQIKRLVAHGQTVWILRGSEEVNLFVEEIRVRPK